MKKTLLSVIFLAGALSVFAANDVPAFPGAEGHGRYVKGGRGGKVIHVTNLNDSGDGSLRAAVSGNSKKIIVFDVSGVIELESDLKLGDNTTILGQTAPGMGITVRYYTVMPKNNNIIRFMRFRRGQERDINDGADAMYAKQVTGILLDHCSFSWSIDEVASFYDNNNFTMQWCTVAESLCNLGHSKGEHGYGGIWGGKLASFHHNLIAHVINRGPRFNGARYGWTGYTSNYNYNDYEWANCVEAENVDFRNCVQYNANGSCYGGPGGGQINMVNNYYKEGPSGNGNYNRITTVSVSTSGNSDSKNPEHYEMTARYYISGNTVQSRTGSPVLNCDWAGVTYDSGVYTSGSDRYSADPNNLYTSVEHKTINGKSCVRIRLDAEAPKGEVTTHKAADAFNKVLDYAGASLMRDAIDARYMEEVRTGTAKYKGSVTKKSGLIDLVSDIDGFPEYESETRPADFDTDRDGMPDAWEIANGLNPNVNDAAAYTLDPKKWYTNIEVYANSLVGHIMKAGNEDAIDSFDEYYPESKQSSLQVVGMRSEVERIEYYDLNGIRLSEPVRGINIRRTVFTDGTSLTDKVIK